MWSTPHWGGANSLAFNSLIQEEKKDAHSRIKRLTFQKTKQKTLQELSVCFVHLLLWAAGKTVKAQPLNPYLRAHWDTDVLRRRSESAKEVSSHAIYTRCPPGPRPLPQRPNFKGHVKLRTSLIRASFFCAVFAQSERSLYNRTTEQMCNF